MSISEIQTEDILTPNPLRGSHLWNGLSVRFQVAGYRQLLT